MHSGKPDKKITVTTKGIQGKKPNIEIHVNDPAVQSLPNGFTNNFSSEDAPVNYKSVSTLPSPSNQKHSGQVFAVVHTIH
jgi:hypothetical protein